MPYMFVCEQCGEEIVVESIEVGRKGICRRCGTHIRVPRNSVPTDRKPNEMMEYLSSDEPHGGQAGKQRRRKRGKADTVLGPKPWGKFLDESFAIYTRNLWRVVAHYNPHGCHVGSPDDHGRLDFLQNCRECELHAC